MAPARRSAATGAIATVGERQLALERSDVGPEPTVLVPPPDEPGLPPSRWPLFVTVGRRRVDGSYTRLGHRASYDVVEDLVKRLGRDAGLPEELRHAHALRHTFATRYYRRTRDLAGLQRLLGHADPKTTMVYVS